MPNFFYKKNKPLLCLKFLLTPFFISIFLLTTTMPVTAEIYKWTDEYGRTHYGDNPKGKPAEEIKYNKEDITQEKAAESWVEIQQRQEEYLNYLEEERQSRESIRETKLEQLSQQKQQCEEAKDYINEINKYQVFYQVDKQGNKEYLSDEEVKENRKKAEDYIKKYC